MTVTVYSILDAVQETLQDVPTTTGAGKSGDRWSAASLITYLNAGQRDIAIRTLQLGIAPAYTKQSPVLLQAGAKQSITNLYNTKNQKLDGTSTATGDRENVIQVLDITRNLGRLWITGTSYDVDDAVYDPNNGSRYVCKVAHTSSTAPNGDSTNWHTSDLKVSQSIVQYNPDWYDTYVPNFTNADPDTKSIVNAWMPSAKDRYTFYVTPAQPRVGNTSTYAFQVVDMLYAALPRNAAAGGYITLNDIYQDALHDYICYRAFSRDDDVVEGTKANGWYQLYLNQPVFNI